MKEIKIETRILRKMLNDVKNGVSKDYFRPELKGILIDVSEGKFKMVTCDGYRIFLTSTEIQNNDNFKVITPLFSIPVESENETTIFIDDKDNYIKFNFGNVIYIYDLIKGEFIDYKMFFKRENKFSIRFNSKLLKDALKSSKGIIEMYFEGDRDGVIIEEIENTNNKKLILPYSKSKKD